MGGYQLNYRMHVTPYMSAPIISYNWRAGNSILIKTISPMYLTDKKKAAILNGCRKNNSAAQKDLFLYFQHIVKGILLPPDRDNGQAAIITNQVFLIIYRELKNWQYPLINNVDCFTADKNNYRCTERIADKNHPESWASS